MVKKAEKPGKYIHPRAADLTEAEIIAYLKANDSRAFHVMPLDVQEWAMNHQSDGRIWRVHDGDEITAVDAICCKKFTIYSLRSGYEPKPKEEYRRVLVDITADGRYVYNGKSYNWFDTITVMQDNPELVVFKGWMYKLDNDTVSAMTLVPFGQDKYRSAFVPINTAEWPLIPVEAQFWKKL